MSQTRDEGGRWWTPGPRYDAAVIVRCSRDDRERWAAEARARGESLAGAIRRLLDGVTVRDPSAIAKGGGKV